MRNGLKVIVLICFDTGSKGLMLLMLTKKHPLQRGTGGADDSH